MRVTSVKEFFGMLPGYLDTEAAEGLEAVYQFDLSGPEGGQYHLIVREGGCSVREGVHPDPHVTLSLSGEDCLGVLNGRLDGSSIAMSGRIQISGEIGLAFQLKTLFPSLPQ
ncbi:MAG: SCP2 sterol-binding domain-containing protein [Nitrospirales bacterium]